MQITLLLTRSVTRMGERSSLSVAGSNRPRTKAVIAFFIALGFALPIAPARGEAAINLLAAVAPAELGAIPLNTGGVAGMPAESWFLEQNSLAVRNVSRATLTPVLPELGKATGAAVIVLPGGGFKFLSMASEAWQVAHYLADHGIAAFVLKYRLTPSPASDAGFNAEIAAVVHALVNEKRHPGVKIKLPTLPTDPAAEVDDAAAMRYVKQHAAQWGIDPSRIGMLGFSAGAITTLAYMQTASLGEQPAFAGLIYGPLSRVSMRADAPPVFAAIAADDVLFGRGGFGLVDEWISAGKHVELHVYDHGGHGFGMGVSGTTTGDWKNSFVHWLASNGVLARSKGPHDDPGDLYPSGRSGATRPDHND